MFRLIGAAALALAATSPAVAQGKGGDNPGKGQSEKGQSEKGQPGGGAAKADHAGMGHSKAADTGSDKGARGNSAVKAERTAERASGSDKLREARKIRAAQRDMYERGGTQAARQIERATATRVDYRDDRHDGVGQWRDDRRSGGEWRAVERERYYAEVPSCPPGLAKKHSGCLQPGQARQARDDTFGYYYRPALFGVPMRAAADYVYYDGYLIPSAGSGRYLPLLGGALAVGQIWPDAYPSLPLADWQENYYGFDDPDGYRYADNVVYQVDPQTSAIQAIAALLTGSDFGIGQPMPAGYDVYNVPAAYQDQYYDNDEALYRYADGQVMQLDPTSLLIEQIIDLIV